MAGGVIAVITRIIGGGAVLVALLAFSFSTVIAVALHGDGLGTLGSYDWQAVRFTIWQALASAGLSVGIAVPVARALARQDFKGRSLLITLLGAPFILPVIVGVLGLLAVFGRAGWISQGLDLFGLDRLSIYGPVGVILAHVFFNLPLATRFILQGWTSIPADRFRVADSLGAQPWTQFQLIEWPMLRAMLPGTFLLIFLLCLTSFAVALAVGGGPRGTTIELAIYQSFHLDFDLGKASSLALIQFVICGTVAVMAILIPLPRNDGLGLGLIHTRQDVQRNRIIDFGFISITAAFLILPLASILIRGAIHLPELPNAVFAAAWTSLWIALISTSLCIGMALSLALSFARTGQTTQKLVEVVGILGLATSPLVVGTGLFLMIFPFAHPMSLAIPVTAMVNAIMALPFALRVLFPAIRDTYVDYIRLRDSLMMSSGTWFWKIILPRINKPLRFAAGLAAALSMGDLGVIALFADPDLQTLPLMLYRLMGAYKMDHAAAIAVVLVAQSLALFWVFDQGGRGHATS